MFAHPKHAPQLSVQMWTDPSRLVPLAPPRPLCSTLSSPGHSHGQSSSGTCCAKSCVKNDELWLNNLGDTDEGGNSDDIERGPSHYERVVLLIGGLQCGCCEGSISRSVTRMTAIRNHHLNVVLARLEFELDTNRLSVADVIQTLHTKTGYTFEKYTAPKGQVLDILATDVMIIQAAELPSGVTCLELSEKQPWHPTKLLSRRRRTITSISEHRNISKIAQYPISIHYDAAKIGARDIFEYYQKYDHNLQLAPATAHASLALGKKQTRQALICFFPALTFTLPVVIFAWAPFDHNRLVYAHVSLACATSVQIIGLKEFIPTALRSLWNARIFEMDLLIALSSTIAYTFSVVSYAFQIKQQPLETGSFFETSTLLVTLILLGRVVNEIARYRAAKSVSFRSLQADEAQLVVPNSIIPPDPKTRTIDTRLLQYGDQFKIAPHTQVVTDGIIIYGGSEIDESMITGESVPVAKGVHSKVFAGTTNGGGTLIAKLTALPHENSVHKIAAMVEDAELTKPKAQHLADKIAGYFVPLMAIIGLLVFLIWLLIGHFHSKRLWKNAAVHAITYSIATLVVSCPCAIGLAVPMVVLIANGVAARFGIIFRNPQKLEIARSVTDVVFDKTGTLTCGNLAVVSEEFYGQHAAQVKGLLLSLLQDVTHPVARGVLRHLEKEAHMCPKKNIRPIAVTDVTSVPGSGVYGKCSESSLVIFAGNPSWLNLEIEESGCTLLCVTISGTWSATFKLKDRPRHTAALVITKLHSQGIHTHMISGDGQGAVDNTAHALGIPKVHTKSRCTPQGKLRYVQDLQSLGNIVMFVGDGTNDSIALKQANVGVHITQSSTSSSSSDVALRAADVILMTTRLHDVLILLDIARAACRRIVLNFVWCAVYNATAVLLAAGALTRAMRHARISPEYAGLGELVSVLPVVLVAVHMRWRDYGAAYREMEYDFQRTGEDSTGDMGWQQGRAGEIECGICTSREGKSVGMRHGLPKKSAAHARDGSSTHAACCWCP